MDDTTLIQRIQSQRDKLDAVLSSYQEFRKHLESLPPDLRAQIDPTPLAQPPEHKPSTEFADKSAADCATIILEERDNAPMHFSEIAREAIRRGYRYKVQGDAEHVAKIVAASFQSAFVRSNRFEATGQGYYRVNTQHQTNGSTGARQRTLFRHNQSTPSMRDRVIAIFHETRSDMRPSEIAKILSERGVTTAALGGMIAMVCSSLIKNPQIFERIEKGVYRLREGR